MTEPMSPRPHIKSVLDALFLASERPLSFDRLVEILPEYSKEEIQEALGQRQQELQQENWGYELMEVAGGFQLRTKPSTSPWIFKLNKAKPLRLSRASLETLSIIAYRQPVTRPEVDAIRGVDSGQVLRNLLEKNLVRILGKREEPGQPLIYGTTKEFLSFFGLRDLSCLPSLKEYSELGEESLKKLEKLLPSQSLSNEEPEETITHEPQEQTENDYPT